MTEDGKEPRKNEKGYILTDLTESTDVNWGGAPTADLTVEDVTKMSVEEVNALADNIAAQQRADATQELTIVRHLARNLVGSLNKLEKAKGRENIIYWTRAVNHWKAEVKNYTEPRNAIDATVNELLEGYKIKIQQLRGEVPTLVVDDLLYRFDSIVDTVLRNHKALDQVTSNPSLDAMDVIQGD